MLRRIDILQSLSGKFCILQKILTLLIITKRGMKALLTTLALILSFTVYAESETAKPTLGVKLEREVTYALIEKKGYDNVTVELKAGDGYWTDGVRVIVTDNETGRRIYKKKFSKSYLYAFSDGEIQVGKGNALTQIILSKRSGYWRMTLKEKGIY